MRKDSFIKGAAVLAAAGMIVKLLGAVFKIPLTNLIGELGMANFTPAYHVYSFFLVFSTAGTPVAISRLVSPPESALAMKWIAPALLFVPLMSSYRGYFQGLQDMGPTAVSQITEQGMQVIVGLALADAMFRGALLNGGRRYETEIGPIISIMGM